MIPVLFVLAAAAGFAAGWWLARSQDRAMKDAFAALSADALRSNGESFLQIARASLDQTRQSATADLDARQKEISALVEPVKQTLDKLETQLRDGGKDQATLRGQLVAVSQTQHDLQRQTQALVNALKSPNQRGQWGELTLRNVLERSGMLQHCDFIEKDYVTTDDGRRAVPDVRVLLPNDACIVIDAKVPIDAFLRWSEADEPAKEGLLREHTRQVREHMKGLAAKTYWARFQPAPEFVVMFVPAEPLFYAAMQNDPGLFDAAISQRVIPASPLTLVALLRTIASAWQQQRLTQNAEEIRELGKELYERLATMAEHVADVGRHLKKAGESYDDFIGSLDSRVLVSARKFKELGVSAGKDLPDDVAPTHIDVREPRATELRVPVQESLIEAELVSSQLPTPNSHASEPTRP
ncbi:MAG TPA: DNA recombination protein RmuC [Vicinamibacterales bacterium]|nr:DNA recombination protein RmuC [Vicinamibacterales bacterium]